MSSFDWLELENLTNDIDLLRDQLVEARSRKAIARVRTLEEEIAQSEERRTKLLAHLTVNMINDAETHTHPRSRRPLESALEPTGDEQRAVAVAQAGSNDEQLEEGILRSEQLAPGEERSPELATLESFARDIDVSRVRLALAKLRKDPDLARRLEEEIATGQAQHERLLAAAAPEAAAATQTVHHEDTIEHPDPEHPAGEDEARVVTELMAQPDHALDDAGQATSAGEVLARGGAEDVEPHPSHRLDPKPGDDGDDPGLVPFRAPLPNEIACEPHPAPATDRIVAGDAAALSIDGAPLEKTPEAEVGDARHHSDRDDHVAASDPSSSTIDPKLDNTEGETAMWDQAQLELAKKEIESRRDVMLEGHCKQLKAMLAEQATELRQLEDDRDELEALEKAIGAALHKFKAPSADLAVTRLDEERASRQQGLS